MSRQDSEMNQKKGMGPVRWIVLIAALAVFCYSGFQLYKILSGYKAASDEYSSLADSFTSAAVEESGGEDLVDTASVLSLAEPASNDSGMSETAASSGLSSAVESVSAKEGEEQGDQKQGDQNQKEQKQGDQNQEQQKQEEQKQGDQNQGEQKQEEQKQGDQKQGEEKKETESETEKPKEAVKHITYKNPETAKEEKYLIEDAAPPLKVNWKELKAINPDIVGWVYVDGLSNISYPVLRGADNDTYLHQTFRKQYLYAGSIFEDANNAVDFADPNTIVYGHNMKDGSMFGMLKNLNDQAKYDEHPFFWILTPEGNYRYHIYSIFTAAVNSETYVLYSQNGPEFLKWEEKMQQSSNVKNNVELMKSDKTVILSTCTSDSSMRCVVIGKCVSTDRPVRKQAVGLTVVGK